MSDVTLLEIFALILGFVLIITLVAAILDQRQFNKYNKSQDLEDLL